MDARGANTFLSHNQLPNPPRFFNRVYQGFRDIFLSPSGIDKRQWRLHCMKNGSDFPARYSWRLHWGLLRVKPSLGGVYLSAISRFAVSYSIFYFLLIICLAGCFSSSTPSSFFFFLPMRHGYCVKLYTRA
ncbi:hypothetical protein P8452_09960 [Trifolium repens]|nr:hypothetical protein P8452_09960 [Trifolium repens]